MSDNTQTDRYNGMSKDMYWAEYNYRWDRRTQIDMLTQRCYRYQIT